jgi:hypothetical protein
MRLSRMKQFCVPLLLAATAPSLAPAESLPQRQTPIPQTTNGVPHMQIGIDVVPALAEELLLHVAQFPGVSLGETRISMPGVVGFQFDEGVPLARPEVIVGGREFAHLHADGSLHASLDPALARIAVDASWSCHAYVPVSQLIYAAFRSNAKGLLPPSDEWRRRGL